MNPQLKQPVKKTIKQEVKDFFNSFNRATKFWSILAYVTYFIIAYFSIEFAGLISGIGSVLVLAVIFYDKKEDIHRITLISPLTFLFYFFLFVVVVVLTGVFIYEKTIKRFNTWLNNDTRTTKSSKGIQE